MSVLVAVGVSTAACSTSSDEQAGGGEVSADALAEAQAAAQEAMQAPTEIPVTTPLSAKPPTGKLIVYLRDPAPASAEIWDGLQQAATAVGWRSEAVKFDPTDLSSFNAGLLQALSMGADYVVDAGIPESQLSRSTVAKFEEAGVPLVVVGTTPVPHTDTLLGDHSDENARVLNGQQLADWFVADSQGEGKAAVVNITTYPTLTLFADSFAEHVSETCPDCEIDPIKVTFGDALDGTLTSSVIAKLRADRSIKYAVFDNSAEIFGLDAQLKAAGLDDVKVIGHSIDPTTVESFAKGQAEAFVAYDFSYTGLAAVDVAVRHSVGDEPGDRDAAQPSQLITSDNIDSLPPTAIFRGPADALEQFKQLWLVSGP